MSIRFSGITHIQGSTNAVKAKLKETKPKENPYLSAYDGRSSSLGEDAARAVVLDGQDAANFLKETYDMDVPEAVRKGGIGFLFSKEKRAIVGAFINELNKKLNSFSFQRKLLAYFDGLKEEGIDAKGNPIKEIEV
jgi:hypothetical protein